MLPHELYTVHRDIVPCSLIFVTGLMLGVGRYTYMYVLFIQYFLCLIFVGNGREKKF